MKLYYDFHIHSALSPCASDEMTPSNIVGMAAVKGLNAIAISDHNSIKNVKAAIECGEDFGITVVPGIEVQTSEDIHVLCLFYDLEALENFYNKLTKRKVKNREDIFGRQLIVDAEDNIVAQEQYLLLMGIEQSIYEVVRLSKAFGGIAAPAHIDREENGILAILGDIPPDLGADVIELSKNAPMTVREKYSAFKQLQNSDAHRLEDISEAKSYIEASSNSIKDILDNIKEKL